MGEEKSRDITGITVRYSDGSTNCYVDALRLVGTVRTDRRTGGHVWGVLGVCAEIRKREHQGRHCVRHEHKTGRN